MGDDALNRGNCAQREGRVVGSGIITTWLCGYWRADVKLELTISRLRVVFKTTWKMRFWSVTDFGSILGRFPGPLQEVSQYIT